MTALLIMIKPLKRVKYTTFLKILLSTIEIIFFSDCQNAVAIGDPNVIKDDAFSASSDDGYAYHYSYCRIHLTV